MDLRRWRLSPTCSGEASKAKLFTCDGLRALRFAGVRAVAAFGLLSIAGCGTPLDPDCWERVELGTGNIDPMIPWSYQCQNEYIPPPPPDWATYQKPGEKYNKERDPTDEEAELPTDD